MAPLTPDQLRVRGRVESVIRLIAPALDVVLAVGERVSRAVERDDVEYYPPRVGTYERARVGSPTPSGGAPGAGDGPASPPSR